MDCIFPVLLFHGIKELGKLSCGLSGVGWSVVVLDLADRELGGVH